ncbi:hypothetical protein NLU13_1134 [Sarocladium strictum]|uniref:Uncharacterized protein n=1 Tax=Sarocladium strictum TaxID=5046 RepID=A0AA39GQD9_SARSR|nr:hypothetical protein NLU13_1134 [Sarocladium strictum]
MSMRDIDTVLPPPKSQSYMDSLQAPSHDDFERIAQIQAEKEAELKRRDRERRHKELLDREQKLSSDNLHERTEAARAIQKTYRGYRARREMNGLGLNATTRWVTAVREAQFLQSTRPQPRETIEAGAAGQNDIRPSSARKNWKKASIVARRAGHDDLLSDSTSTRSSSSLDEGSTPAEREKRRANWVKRNVERRHEARMMGLQYFLEMVDLKHRYGSNLRTYHEEWKRADTQENFFYWLDHGEGRNIDLTSCPRERLNREQVRYLSREERQYYLVNVDDQGRLCWAKNGARIDTTEKYKDSIHGIVPSDDTTPPYNPDAQPESPSMDAASDSASTSSLESSREADRAAKYANPGLEESTGMRKVTHLSASTIFNRLLRKSVKKNTWIFVADTSFRLYVGIKNSGAFQHSSFMQGSRISAAGLIKIKDGYISSLSPLSGHYRPPASNFRAFLNSLKESDVDMRHVSISKSYVVLVGLEAYIKTRTKGKALGHKVLHHRDKILDPEEVARREEEARDKSESAEKERKFLEEQRQREEAEREENKATAKMMQKLKLVPREPKGQPVDEVREGTVGESVQMPGS